MQVIDLRTLRLFWQKNANAELPLRTWYAEADAAQWLTPQAIKNDYGTSVDFVADNRVIFDIGGNNFRLIVHVSYEYKRVLINLSEPTRNTTR